MYSGIIRKTGTVNGMNHCHVVSSVTDCRVYMFILLYLYILVHVLRLFRHWGLNEQCIDTFMHRPVFFIGEVWGKPRISKN